MVKFPCMKCGKPVPKKRREECEDAEMASERYYDNRFHMMYDE